MIFDPKTVKLSNKIIFGAILFAVIFVVLCYGVYSLFTDTIYMEDDTVMPMSFKILISTVFCIAGIGLLNLVITIFKRLIEGRGAMTLTYNGITDTFVIFNLLCVWTAVPVKLIPWYALKYNADEDNLSVDTKRLNEEHCGKFAKLILKFGFGYKIGKISSKEIEALLNEAKKN